MSKRKTRRGGPTPYLPTEEEIRGWCRIFQESWTDQHEQNHVVGSQAKRIHADTEVYHITMSKRQGKL